MTPNRTAQRSRPVALLTWKEWQELALLLEMLEENLDLEVREATEDDTLFGAKKNLRRTQKMSKRIQHLARALKTLEMPKRAKRSSVRWLRLDATHLNAIMERFVELATQLSPENLTHDGELSTDRVVSKRAALQKEWHALEKKLGRTATEEQVWEWHDTQEMPHA